MMNDEEKKAVEIIKSKININEFMPRLVFSCENIETILNLVDKQQKEIEELKEDNRIQRKVINSAFDRGWIHKDKIKAEIEEIKNMKVDGEVFKTSVNFAIKVLQSLLEGSEDNGK